MSREAYARRPGQPFDESRLEDFVRARAKGENLSQAAQYAGIGRDQAKTWEAAPEVRERLRELRAGQETGHTVSVAWIVNELKRNAQMARECDPPQLKSSNESLKLLYEIVTKDKGLLGDLGQLPRANKELRSELTRRLSGGTAVELPTFETDGEEVPA